ncbi:serine/threonine protein kinase [Streptomyces albus]|nr:serine/threonine protein kinase [Streptomyces albus]
MVGVAVWRRVLTKGGGGTHGRGTARRAVPGRSHVGQGRHGRGVPRGRRRTRPARRAQDAFGLRRRAVRRRLRREAELVSRLADPHIVDVFDTGDSDDGGLYVALRLVEGPDLRRVLAEGPLDPQRAVGILSQVAQALDAAHTGGVVHRDVKPSNILIGPDGDAHLTDFGIARPLEPGVTRLTRTGAYVGSLDYIAPEQLRGRDVTGTADVYSLACVLYECLTGKVPFPAADPAAKLAAQLNDPPAAPSVFDPRIPPALDMVVATGMDKDPQRRFASAGELMAAAASALGDGAPRDRAEPTVV